MTNQLQTISHNINNCFLCEQPLGPNVLIGCYVKKITTDLIIFEFHMHYHAHCLVKWCLGTFSNIDLRENDRFELNRMLMEYLNNDIDKDAKPS